jgi:hypothetical protein
MVSTESKSSSGLFPSSAGSVPLRHKINLEAVSKMHLTSNGCVAIRFKMLTYCVYAALLNLIDALPLKVTYNFETASTKEEVEFREEIAMHARKEDQIKDEKPNNSINSLIWFGICLLLLFVNVAEFLFH